MKFKKGVKLAKVSPQIAIALIVVNEVYARNGQELVVTAVSDGKHSDESLHYEGHAVDCRTSYFTQKEQFKIVEELKEAMDDNFDIVLEPTHLHIEYDPI